jgi:hypothetical protein
MLNTMNTPTAGKHKMLVGGQRVRRPPMQHVRHTTTREENQQVN